MKTRNLQGHLNATRDAANGFLLFIARWANGENICLKVRLCKGVFAFKTFTSSLLIVETNLTGQE